MNLSIVKCLFLFVFFLFSATIHAREGRSALRPEAWPQLKTLTGIKAGNAAGMIQLIVLFDADCPYCAKLWSHLYQKDSRYQNVTSLWVPVAYLGQHSAGKAARLLAANSWQALANNFEQFDFERRSGAAIPSIVTPNVKRTLDRNISTWRKVMTATPVMIYKTRDGAVFSQVGYPPSARLIEILDDLAPNELQEFGS